MTDENRCEPLPEWRDREGWYWLKKGGSKLPAYWTPRDEWWDAVHFSGNARTVAAMGFSVTAAVTPPATVAALVEALEAVSVAIPAVLDAADIDASDTVFTVRAVSPTGSRELAQRSLADMLEAARAALALYREAGR